MSSFSCHLTKNLLDALRTLLKFLGMLTLNICGGVSFQHTYK